MIKNKIVSANAVWKATVLYILALMTPLQAYGYVDGKASPESSPAYAEARLAQALGESAVGASVDPVGSTANDYFDSSTARASTDWGSIAGLSLAFASLLAVFNCRRGRKRPNVTMGSYTEHVT